MPPIDYTKIITIEAGKRSGQPCIRGMRMTVYDVWNTWLRACLSRKSWTTSPT